MSKKIELHASTLLAQRYADQIVGRLFVSHGRTTSTPFWIKQDLVIESAAGRKEIQITGYAIEPIGTPNPFACWLNLVFRFVRADDEWILSFVRINERNTTDFAWALSLGFRTTDLSGSELTIDYPITRLPLAA